MNLTVKDIIERIAYFRNKKKYSARKLSIAIGKSEAYIHQLENMGFDITVSSLLEILDVLEISAEQFFYRDEKNYEKDKELIEYINRLHPEQKEAILHLYRC